jgi:hypothetical protein
VGGFHFAEADADFPVSCQQGGNPGGHEGHDSFRIGESAGEMAPGRYPAAAAAMGSVEAADNKNRRENARGVVRL